LSSRLYLKEFVCQTWSKLHLNRPVRKEDVYGLPSDSFIGRGRFTTFLENPQPV